jgi:hypothetical protein
VTEAVARAVESVGARQILVSVHAARVSAEQATARRQTMNTIDVWVFRDQADLGYDPTGGTDVTGYHVEALDGSIGKVDKANNDVAQSYLIVDTGPWIFGKKVMLPAGVIDHVSTDEQLIFVNRTKDQIKASPEYDDSKHEDDDEYRSELGSYYAPGGMGYRDQGEVNR